MTLHARWVWKFRLGNRTNDAGAGAAQAEAEQDVLAPETLQAQDERRLLIGEGRVQEAHGERQALAEQTGDVVRAAQLDALRQRRQPQLLLVLQEDAAARRVEAAQEAPPAALEPVLKTVRIIRFTRIEWLLTCLPASTRRRAARGAA